jgi:hypothetical protein
VKNVIAGEMSISKIELPPESLTSAAMPEMVTIVEDKICFLVPSGRTSFGLTMRLPEPLRAFSSPGTFMDIAKQEVGRHKKLLAELAKY